MKDNFGYFVGETLVWTTFAESHEEAVRIFNEFATKWGDVPISAKDVLSLMELPN